MWSRLCKPSSSSHAHFVDDAAREKVTGTRNKWAQQVRYAVVGLGDTGTSTLKFLKSFTQHPIWVLEDDRAKLEGIDFDAADASGRWMQEGDVASWDRNNWDQLDVVVVSPGIAPHHEWIVQAAALGKDIMCDLGLLHACMVASGLRNKARMIAITGTNGKSTTTQMIHTILSSRPAPHRSWIGGNFGTPVFDWPFDHLQWDLGKEETLIQADDKQHTDGKEDARLSSVDMVVEVSSYQAHWSQGIVWDVAVLTNLDIDHLDWHLNLEAYWHSKQSLFIGPFAARHGVMNIDHVESHAWAKQRALSSGLRSGTNTPFDAYVESPQVDIKTDAWVVALNHVNDSWRTDVVGQVQKNAFEVWACHDGKSWPLNTHSDVKMLQDISVQELGAIDCASAIAKMEGVHNHINFMLAYHTCIRMGMSRGAVLKAAIDIAPLPHRMSTVAIHCVKPDVYIRFVDDSKSTNMPAALIALASYQASFWIVGGKPKPATHLSQFASVFKQIVKAYAIGQWMPQLMLEHAEHEPKPPFDLMASGDLRSALIQALRDAKEWSNAHNRSCVVLLAPAAASFDQFLNYKQRGDLFAQYVHEALGITNDATNDAAHSAQKPTIPTSPTSRTS